MFDYGKNDGQNKHEGPHSPCVCHAQQGDRKIIIGANGLLDLVVALKLNQGKQWGQCMCMIL